MRLRHAFNLLSKLLLYIIFLLILHFYIGPADYAYNGHKYTKLLDKVSQGQPVII